MSATALHSDLRDSAVRRRTMVDCQVRTFDVTDQRLLARLLEVPRERFVPDDDRELAYSDVGLTIGSGPATGEGRYLLSPMVLARLIQGGRIRAAERVLDVASGGGYSTAILAGLAADVVTLEDTTDRRRDLETRLASYDLARIQVIERSLPQGVAEAGPYDVILINGAVEEGLETLFGQLKDGGRLLAIQRDAADPTGRAAKAMCFAKRNGAVGIRYLFDASAPVLPGFERPRAFTF